jgi:hypothetical protein
MRFVKPQPNALAQTRFTLRAVSHRKWGELRSVMLAAVLLSMTAVDAAEKRSEHGTYELLPIDRVWAGHAVRFALDVTDGRIFVAYYDAQRQLTVASRARHGGGWTYRKLDTRTGWDSHNYIAMSADSAGQLHIVGNLHNDPLIYFRTSSAGDIHSFTRIPVLVHPAVEQRMTYPVFLEDRAGRMILKYRDGGSGNGNEIYDVYDTASSTWSHLLATPLVDGEGRRNAYFVGPTLGPDGLFHLVWVWRETPDAETNHDLSYARSRDLVHWEKSDGTPLKLPITLANAEIVDPVPVAAGMINNNTVIGFDSAGRPVITFHKFDAQGNTQIFLARREAARWNIVPITRWRDFRWDFRGRGSLDMRLLVKGAVPADSRHLSVEVVRDGEPIEILLESRSLRRVSEAPRASLARRLQSLIDVPKGMQLNTVEHPSGGLAIAWPTRPPNRDLPTADIPEPTVLNLVIRAQPRATH